MKYVRTAGFLIDLRRLPPEHRKMFVLAVHTLLSRKPLNLRLLSHDPPEREMVAS
jgi:hypothetical protein